MWFRNVIIIYYENKVVFFFINRRMLCVLQRIHSMNHVRLFSSHLRYTQLRNSVFTSYQLKVIVLPFL